jgi:acetyl-CoA acetyltransferase family protein
MRMLRLLLAITLALSSTSEVYAAVAAAASAARGAVAVRGLGSLGAVNASAASLSGASLMPTTVLPTAVLPTLSLGNSYVTAAALPVAAVAHAAVGHSHNHASAQAAPHRPQPPVQAKLQTLAAKAAKEGGASQQDMQAEFDGIEENKATDAVDVEANISELQADIEHRTGLVREREQPRAQRIAVVAAGRLPQGKFPNSFSKKDGAKELGTKLVQGLLSSAGLSVDALKQMADAGDEVKILFGAVDNSESPDIGREIATSLGLTHVPGTGMCKNCGTSLETVSLGISALIAGDADVIIAGGAESMSRLPLMTKNPVLQKQFLTLAVLPSMIKSAPFWKKPILKFVQWKTGRAYRRAVGGEKMRYAITEGLTIDGDVMAQTAQTLADKYGISRVDMDWFAYASQLRASLATQRGEFADEIIPYDGAKGTTEVDQGIRFGQSRKGFGSKKIQPVFGTQDITAANASQISDGASGVVLMTEEKAKAAGLTPLAYVSAVADTAGAPAEMGIQPAYAIPKALKKAGMALADVEAIEINEAFAAQTLAVMKALGLPLNKVNSRGGAIAIGHPLAASGARVLTTLIHNMMHKGLHKGVCSLCIGGGEGIAAVVERDPSGIPSSYIGELRARLGKLGISQVVLEDVERTLRGLPPLSEGHPEVRTFLTFLNTAAGWPVGPNMVFEPLVYDELTEAARSWVKDVIKDEKDMVRSGEAIHSFYPGFKDRFEAEFGAGTYTYEEAMARVAAMNAYEILVGASQVGPLPEGLRAVFERGPEEGGSSSTPTTYILTAIERGAKFDESNDLISAWISLSQNRLVWPVQAPPSAALKARLDDRIMKIASDLGTFGHGHDRFKHLRVSDADGVAHITIHREPVNALNEDLVREIDTAMEELNAREDVKSIIFTGEGKMFMAGADINLINKAETEDEAGAAAAGLQVVIDKIEASDKAVFMALNGQALGGGSELAMAGHERWASGLAELGQPEVKLLFNPGAGGTQRLVRLVGLTQALTMMNTGASKDAHTAKKMGWVDEVVAPADLLVRVKARATEVAHMSDGERAAWIAKRRTLTRQPKLTLLERIGMLFGGYLIKRQVAAETRKLGKDIALPAMMGIIDATLHGLKHGPKAGLKKEVEVFGRLAASPGSKFVQRLFLRSTGGPKIAGVTDGTIEPAPVKKVGVVGAGAMGAGIAQLAAYNGISVVLKDVNKKGLESGLDKIRGLFDGLVSKMKFSPEQAAEKVALVEGLTDDLAFRQRDLDLVIEAVVENMALKKKLFKQWGEELPEKTILATNTSALSVTEIALASGRPGKVVGLHYFNPPHKLPLVELILPNRDKLTAEQAEELKRTLSTVTDYMKKTGRIVVVTEDAPGFVVNRMLVPYIGEALRLLEEGAGIAQIDRVMKKLGLPMGPLQLADHVGFFLGIEVGEYLSRELPHLGQMSLMLKVLDRWGYKGSHWGEKRGFYSADAANEQVVREAAAVAQAIEKSGAQTDGDLADQIDALTEQKESLARGLKRNQRVVSDEEIEERLLLLLANEGARIVDEGVAAAADDIDIAMTTGTGFPPQTGGLMTYVAARWGRATAARLAALAEKHGERYSPSAYWR